jgi:hypothetical protein
LLVVGFRPSHFAFLNNELTALENIKRAITGSLGFSGRAEDEAVWL